MEARRKLERVRHEGFQEGYQAGKDQGTKDATIAVRANAFSDLSNVWGQVTVAHKAAAQYAEIIASMYSARTNIRKDSATDTKAAA